MSEGRPSEWPALFDIAIRILSHFERTAGFMPAWTFGGGTALMLEIDHRESHDIDLFIEDPQVLPFLNPETQGIPLERRPDTYETDGAGVLKLAYKNLGEIDFICCANIVDTPAVQREVRGHTVRLETPAEVIAKKVYYRGWNFQPRDMFDLAAVSQHFGPDYVLAALRQCGSERCQTALQTIENAAPAFVEKMNSQLMFRESTRHLVGRARDISRNLLAQALPDSETR
ncbi:MAG TPA: nucleotidyl transferase AbiEii/AbiGii toxin family protein [Alteraurantiacibacter sp.]|jgi:hypothetical protein